MNKFSIILLSTIFIGCVVPSSSVSSNILTDNITEGYNNSVNDVINSNSKTMIALNYILPQKAIEFEMLTNKVILPAIKKQNKRVYESLKFLVPEASNSDGTLTFMFIANPYYENENYDIFKILVSQFGRSSAEKYFDQWISCFAYEQEVISFR